MSIPNELEQLILILNELGQLILLLTFIILLLFFTARIRSGHRPILRRIAAFDTLKGANSRAIEAGQSLHLSLGLGSIGTETTSDTLAGLSVLDYLAEQAAITKIHPTISMADPTVMLFAQNALKAAHNQDKQETETAYRHVQWIAPQPAAYAAGVMGLIGLDDINTNIMIGNFGEEYLLLGEAAARQDGPHIGGTGNPAALPFIYASAQETLLGEEIYAAGAYLQKKSAHLGSLLAQDTMRWIIFAIILGGVIATSWK